MKQGVIALVMAFFASNDPANLPPVNNYVSSGQLLAQREISLGNRQVDPKVNEVFKDNILLNLAYMSGNIYKASDIDWRHMKEPFHYEFQLDPLEVFAYHDDILSEYKGKVTKTTQAHFGARDGFKTDGYLYGDGICHLASIINWAAQDAKLQVVAPTRHDFARIPEIPKEYGVSIYYRKGAGSTNTRQNLYITNTRDRPVRFTFDYFNNILKVSVYKIHN